MAGAFPSASGKTNLAMLIPTLEGWTAETVGDDIAWMKFGEDGRLYAVNPEAGFFGVAPEHEPQDEPERDGDRRAKLDLHQLRADRRRRRVVGGDDRRAARPRDRLARQRLDARVRGARPRTRTRASRRRPPSAPRSPPSGRTPTACRSTPSCSAAGGRRTVPLVTEAFDWEHGVFLGATMSVETTAAAAGEVGKLRFDPMAMLPFCGYNMADYFGHWLRLAADARVPRSCRGSSSSTGSARTTTATSSGPGYGENSRVLEWICPPLRRRGGDGRDPDRAGARPGTAQHRGPRHHRRGDGAAPTGRPGDCFASSSRRSRSTWPASATAFREGSASSSRRSGAGSRADRALSSSSPGARRPRPAPGPCAPASRPG